MNEIYFGGKFRKMAQTLYNDDCLKILKSIKDKSIDLIVTDPHYEITDTISILQSNLLTWLKSL